MSWPHETGKLTSRPRPSIKSWTFWAVALRRPPIARTVARAATTHARCGPCSRKPLPRSGFDADRPAISIIMTGLPTGCIARITRNRFPRSRSTIRGAEAVGKELACGSKYLGAEPRRLRTEPVSHLAAYRREGGGIRTAMLLFSGRFCTQHHREAFREIQNSAVSVCACFEPIRACACPVGICGISQRHCRRLLARKWKQDGERAETGPQ